MKLNMIPITGAYTLNQLPIITAPLAKWAESVDTVCIYLREPMHEPWGDIGETFYQLNKQCKAVGLNLMGGFELTTLKVPGDPNTTHVGWPDLWKPERFRKANRIAETIRKETKYDRVLLIHEPDAAENDFYLRGAQPNYDLVKQCYAELYGQWLFDYWQIVGGTPTDPNLPAKCQLMNETILPAMGTGALFAMVYPGTYIPDKTDPWSARERQHRNTGCRVETRLHAGWDVSKGYMTSAQISEHTKKEFVWTYCNQSEWSRLAHEFAELTP